MDTIVYGISNVLNAFPVALKGVSMFWANLIINFPIVSASGQAGVVMPIFTPVADMIGITRQTAVLAYNFGDGFCNYIIPWSSALMGNLAVANIPSDRWMKFFWKMFLVWVALGSVLLPSLSAAFNQSNLVRYNSLLDRGLRLVILLAVPAAVGLGFLAEGLAAVLFQGKSFGASDVLMTAVAIEGYAVGLLGLISIKILAPAFYSRKDIKTPVKGAIASLIVVQACNLVTVPALGHAGLALSVGLGAVFNALVLFALLRRRGWYTPAKGWIVYAVRVLVGSAVMGAFLIWAQTGLDWAGMQALWSRRLVLVAGVILGAAVTYFLTLAILGWRGRELRGAD